MTTAKNVNQTAATPVSPVSPISHSQLDQTVNTSVQLMEDSTNPKEKDAAFKALFYAATNDTLTTAVDYLYDNPNFFSGSVKDLCASIKAKKYVPYEPSLAAKDQETLKKFVAEMGDAENRIIPFMEKHFEEAMAATTWSDYRKALTPYFALKNTFEIVKKAACPCSEAYKSVDTFNTVDTKFMSENIGRMYKKVGTLDMDK